MPAAVVMKIGGVWEQKHPQPSRAFKEVIESDVERSLQLVLKPLKDGWLS